MHIFVKHPSLIMTWKRLHLNPHLPPAYPTQRGCEQYPGVNDSTPCFLDYNRGYYWSARSFWGPDFPNRLSLGGAQLIDSYVDSQYKKYAPQLRADAPYMVGNYNGVRFL